MLGLKYEFEIMEKSELEVKVCVFE